MNLMVPSKVYVWFFLHFSSFNEHKSSFNILENKYDQENHKCIQLGNQNRLKVQGVSQSYPQEITESNFL